MILHHYQVSPFSQKVRSILGFKQARWSSVQVPTIMPKPDVVALTGGYRRTPFLQVGADIYCDTALVADVLDQLLPGPTLYPAHCEGAARILAQWADSTLFWCAVSYAFQPRGMQNIFPGATAEHLKAFAADRGPFRASISRMSLAEATGSLTLMVGRLEQMLSADQPWLLGSEASIADFSAYHPLWFVRNAAGLHELLGKAPRLLAWMDRIAALGDGQVEDMSAAQALEVARTHAPADSSRRPFVDTHGVALGSEVVIQASDYGMEPTQGQLVLADANEWALRRHDERAGEVVVHFPRLGFQLKPLS